MEALRARCKQWYQSHAPILSRFRKEHKCMATGQHYNGQGERSYLRADRGEMCRISTRGSQATAASARLLLAVALKAWMDVR